MARRIPPFQPFRRKPERPSRGPKILALLDVEPPEGTGAMIAFLKEKLEGIERLLAEVNADPEPDPKELFILEEGKRVMRSSLWDLESAQAALELADQQVAEADTAFLENFESSTPEDIVAMVLAYLMQPEEERQGKPTMNEILELLAEFRPELVDDAMAELERVTSALEAGQTLPRGE